MEKRKIDLSHKRDRRPTTKKKSEQSEKANVFKFIATEMIEVRKCVSLLCEVFATDYNLFLNLVFLPFLLPCSCLLA